MSSKAYLLILLGLAILTSGCLDNSGTEPEGDTAITVEEWTVTPQNIVEDASTTAILHIRNSGEIPANLTINSNLESSTIEECSLILESNSIEDLNRQDVAEYNRCVEEEQESEPESLENNKGDRILTDRCRDILDVEEFSVRGPGDASGDRHLLMPQDNVRFTWSLSSEGANAPIQGLTCNLRFEVPFDYSVTAFRQMQFLESRDVGGVPDLDSRSSRGPMMIDIGTRGATSERGDSVFIEGDPAEITIRMINQGREGTSRTGFIDGEVPEVEARGFDFQGECPPEDLQDEDILMHEGESQIIRCSVDTESMYEDLDESERVEVQARSNYSYVKSLGSQTVEVEHRAN